MLDNLKTYRSVAHDLVEAVANCPLGYHAGRIIRHRTTTDADVIAWLQRLTRIAEAAKETVRLLSLVDDREIHAAQDPRNVTHRSVVGGDAAAPICSACGSPLTNHDLIIGTGTCGVCRRKAMNEYVARRDDAVKPMKTWTEMTPAEREEALDELRAALRDVPPQALELTSRTWWTRLHRAACEVAGIGVREKTCVVCEKPATGFAWGGWGPQCNYCGSDACREQIQTLGAAAAVRREAPNPSTSWRDEPSNCPTCGVRRTVVVFPVADCIRCGKKLEGGAGSGVPVAAPDSGWLPGRAHLRCVTSEDLDRSAERMSSEGPPPEVRDCLRCGAGLLFSARQRGDGLCGPCHRKATGTQTLADRCREAGIEPPLVLEILRSPEGRAAIAECMRRPPVRMPDGTWREPTPGSEAKVGDLVRRLRGHGGGVVQRITEDGELWLCVEGGGYETARASDVEVTVPAEHGGPRANPFSRPDPGIEQQERDLERIGKIKGGGS